MRNDVLKLQCHDSEKDGDGGDDGDGDDKEGMIANTVRLQGSCSITVS